MWVASKGGVSRVGEGVAGGLVDGHPGICPGRIQGYVAEKTFDEDFTYQGSQPPDIPPETWEVEDPTTSDETREDEVSSEGTA